MLGTTDGSGDFMTQFDAIVQDSEMFDGRRRELSRRPGSRGPSYRMLRAVEDRLGATVVGTCAVVLAVAWSLPSWIRWISIAALLIGPGLAVLGLCRRASKVKAMPDSWIVVVPLSFAIVILVALCLDGAGVRLTGQSLGLTLGVICAGCALGMTTSDSKRTKRNRDATVARRWGLLLAVGLPICMAGIVGGVMATWPPRAGGEFVALGTSIRVTREAAGLAHLVVTVQATAGSGVSVRGSVETGSPLEVVSVFQRHFVVGASRQARFRVKLPNYGCDMVAIHAVRRGGGPEVSDVTNLADEGAKSCAVPIR